MVVATSDGQKTYVTNGPEGGVIYALSTDADGSNLTGLGGDDSLRGNKYNDVLDGGSGNDSYYGGLGSDIFRIDISDIKDGSDTDTLLDLNLEDGKDGDILSLDGFAAGTFHDVGGADANATGTHVRVGTWAALHDALTTANGINVSASQIGSTDNLYLTIEQGGTTQNLVIKGGYAAFIAAGGLVA